MGHQGRRRPYRVEYTGSLLTSEVKRRRARLVLGWGTAWEDLRVLSAFLAFLRKVVENWRFRSSSAPRGCIYRAVPWGLGGSPSGLGQAIGAWSKPQGHGASPRRLEQARGRVQCAHMFAKRPPWGSADRASHWEYPLSCHPMGGGQWSFREHQHDLQTMLMTYPNQAGSL